jgi:hypothetical protein
VQRFTLQIGSRKVISDSSTYLTRIRGLHAGLRDHRSGVSVQLLQAARQLRHAAGILTAPAVAG